MASIARAVATKITDLLRAPAGVNENLASLALSEDVEVARIEEGQIALQNVAAEMLEKSAGAAYPCMQVYCEKLVNDLRQKFQVFSGAAQMAIEIRVSQDRLEGLEGKLEVYATAVTQILERSRGEWGDGMSYWGGYQVSFAPVKRGGRSFLQSAKVSFEVAVNRN